MLNARFIINYASTGHQSNKVSNVNTLHVRKLCITSRIRILSQCIVYILTASVV
jgi:hypothetical protein